LTFAFDVVRFVLAVKNRELASFRRTVPLRSGPHIRRLNPQVRNNQDDVERRRRTATSNKSLARVRFRSTPLFDDSVRRIQE